MVAEEILSRYKTAKTEFSFIPGAATSQQLNRAPQFWTHSETPTEAHPAKRVVSWPCCSRMRGGSPFRTYNAIQ
jgi:hypothetical protein